MSDGEGLSGKVGKSLLGLSEEWDPVFSRGAIHHIDADMAVTLDSRPVLTLPGSHLCTSGKTGEEEMREK